MQNIISKSNIDYNMNLQEFESYLTQFKTKGKFTHHCVGPIYKLQNQKFLIPEEKEDEFLQHYISLTTKFNLTFYEKDNNILKVFFNLRYPTASIERLYFSTNESVQKLIQDVAYILDVKTKGYMLRRDTPYRKDINVYDDFYIVFPEETFNNTHSYLQMERELKKLTDSDVGIQTTLYMYGSSDKGTDVYKVVGENLEHSTLVRMFLNKEKCQLELESESESVSDLDIPIQSLRIEPRVSTLTSEIFEEHMDTKSCLKVLHTLDLCKNNKYIIQNVNTLKNWVSTIEKQIVIKTHYHHSKKVNFGRIYYSDSSLFSLYRNVRNTLLQENGYVDLDLENCHYNILLDLCKKSNIECEAIQEYCTDRDKLVKKVMKKYDVDRDTAKNLFTRILFGGSFQKWCVDNYILDESELKIIKRLKNELVTIHTKMIESNQHLVGLFSKDSDSNSLISFILQYHEVSILEEMVYMTRSLINNKNRFILMHDGFAILKKDISGFTVNDICSKINEHILQKLGFNIKLVEKKFNDVIDTSISNVCWNPLVGACEENKICDLFLSHFDILSNEKLFLKYNNVLWERVHPDVIKSELFQFAKQIEMNLGKVVWCKKKSSRINKSLIDIYTKTLKKKEIAPDSFSEIVKSFLEQEYNTYTAEDDVVILPDRCFDRFLSVFPHFKEHSYLIQQYNAEQIKIEYESKFHFGKNVIQQNIFQLIKTNTYFNTDMLDRDKDLIACENKIFNLKTGLEIEPSKDQYISRKCAFVFEDTDEERQRVKYLDEKIKQIFDVHYNLCMTAYASSITGYQPHNLFIQFGEGRNGKSIVTDMNHIFLGEYSCKQTSDCLTHVGNINPNQATTMLNAMIGARYVYCEEPKGKSLNISLVKEITGSQTISYRKLHQEQGCKSEMYNTTFLSTNQLPRLDEKSAMEDSLRDRIIIIPFNSYFYGEDKTPEEIQTRRDKGQKCYPIDRNFKEELSKYKQAWFTLLLPFAKKYIETKTFDTSTVKQVTEEYFKNQSDFTVWLNAILKDQFNPNLSIEENKKINQQNYKNNKNEWSVSIKKIHTMYLESNYTSNMTRYQRKQLSVTPIEETLAKIKSIYKDRVLMRDQCWGVRVTSDILVGFTIKNDDE